MCGIAGIYGFGDADLIRAMADGDEDERARGAEDSLHQNGRSGVGFRGRPAASVLDDADGVATDGGREHLAGGLANEVHADEPPERLVNALGREKHSPAPRHHPCRREEDPQGGHDVPDVAFADELESAPEVELPEEERDDAARYDELDGDPHPARHVRTLDDRCRKPWAKRPSGFGVNHQLKTRSTTRLAALPSASPQ